MFLGVLKNENVCIAIKTNKPKGIIIILTNMSYLVKKIKSRYIFKSIIYYELYIEIFNRGKNNSSDSGCPLPYFSPSESKLLQLPTLGYFRNSS